MHMFSFLILCSLMIWGQSFGFVLPEVDGGSIGIYTEDLDSSMIPSSSTPLTTKEEDAPPIEPSLIEYISSALETPECKTVFALLSVQDSAQKMHKFLNISSTMEYADYLKQAHNQLRQEEGGSSSLDNFNCSASLKYWNEVLMGSSTKDKRDKQDFAETVLGVWLSQVDRDDLEKLLHIRIQQIQHGELEFLKDEIESHTGWIRLPPSNATYHHSRPHPHHSTHNSSTILHHTENNDSIQSKSDDGGFSTFLSFLIILVFVGSFMFGCLLTVATCYSYPRPKAHSRPSQSSYRRINSTEGDNLEGKKDAKDKASRASFGDLKRATTSESLPLLQDQTETV